MFHSFAGFICRSTLILVVAIAIAFVTAVTPGSAGAQISRPVSCPAAQSFFDYAVNRWMISPDGSPAKSYWDAQASYWETYLDEC
jgi:hypothetical protein